MFAKKDNSSQQQGFFKRLRARLNRGDSWLTYDLAKLAPGGKIDEDVLEELESLLVMADVGIATTERITGELQARLARKELKDIDALRQGLRSSLLAILEPVSEPLEISASQRPFVILMVGVNGAGKTTTIGKLARRFQDQGLSVMLAAGDTFRAAAVEQLQVWGERNDVPVVAQHSGADPAAAPSLQDTYVRCGGCGLIHLTHRLEDDLWHAFKPLPVGCPVAVPVDRARETGLRKCVGEIVALRIGE